MLWSKQYYYFDLDTWLEEHDAHPMLGNPRHARNAEWFHMLNNDIISMPDKWEYPWYAAWDLAFHTLALSLVDFDFAKDQLLLMLRTLYSHPNGQMPAYEWNFSDVNPPVHAWATLFLFSVERELGRADLRFLERSFQGLMLNFNWWVNRKDPSGKNVFAGGFLGLDNIGVFDRSAQLPTGGHLDQADGTAWMAFYCQNMLEIALTLAEQDPIYEDIAYRFLEHFIWITYAMDRIGDQRDEMWDEEDGFFYDLLHLPDGRAIRLKVRSMVGLLPLCASTVLEEGRAKNLPRLLELIALFKKRHPEMLKHIAPADDRFIGYNGRRLMAVCNRKKTERILAYMLDEKEFLSPYGIRSLSRYHLDHPFVFHHAGQEFRVQYLPGESNNGMFGGNSNWRGPIWMPVNGLLIRALMNLYQFYGDDFKVECPTGSGTYMTLYEVAEEIGRRLSRIFLRDDERTAPHLRRNAQASGRPALEGLHHVLRVLPRRQRRRPRRQPPDGLDRAHRAVARLVRAWQRRHVAGGFEDRGHRPDDPRVGGRSVASIRSPAAENASTSARVSILHVPIARLPMAIGPDLHAQPARVSSAGASCLHLALSGDHLGFAAPLCFSHRRSA